MKTSIPFCELLFVSDPMLLKDHFEAAKLAIYLRGKGFLLAIDEWLLGRRLPLLYHYGPVTLFKASRAGGMVIVNLYTELAMICRL